METRLASTRWVKSQCGAATFHLVIGVGRISLKLLSFPTLQGAMRVFIARETWVVCFRMAAWCIEDAKIST
jgi:hypothetical protein